MKPFITKHHSNHNGFTLIELLVVVVMIGILSAIMSPSLVGWANNQRVGAARSQVADALRKAQTTARKTKVNQEVRFRANTDGSQPEFAIVPVRDIANSTGKPTRPTDAQIRTWQTLETEAKKGLFMRLARSPYQPGLDQTVAGRTTKSGIVFDPYGAVILEGNPDGREALGVYTIQISTKNDANKRCVIVQSLLGGMREGKKEECTL
jgi:prepilin-type N-terminal cleavage/methylation domain-containing protein